MGWETRDGRGQYYTRSRRVGRRVVREYVGTGELAERAAAGDAERRAARQADADAWRTERGRLDKREAAIDAFTRAVEAAFRARLLLEGFRRHAQGPWRRRRRP